MLQLTGVLVAALLVRLLTFNGSFGSDDITYFERAWQLTQGDWSSANYNGALRYGFNIPAAGFMAVFGTSLFAANLWPLFCSLVEVAAVFFFARAVMGQRAGLFAALLLASAPLHVAVATRIHADPVVSMFSTLSFVLLYFGVQSRSARTLFLSGLCIGGVFWAKELAAVIWFALLPMLWFFRSQWRNTLWVVLGVAVMLVLHGLLMAVIAGDPLHLVKVVRAAVDRNFVHGGVGEDAAGYYFKYLFLDIRHSGLLGVFAALSFWWCPAWLRRAGVSNAGFLFAVMWFLGLLAVLSFFPVSLSPLKLTMKQSNYITLFLAPAAVLAGMAIAALPALAGRLVTVFCIVIGLALSAMQQADYRVFTANSKAVAAFAVSHPRALLVGTTNNASLGSFLTDRHQTQLARAKIVSFADVQGNHSGLQNRLQDAEVIYAVLDPQTAKWFSAGVLLTDPLPCWKHPAPLEPLGLGIGNRLASSLAHVFTDFQSIAKMMGRLARPAVATVYEVDGGDVFCRNR